MTFLTGTQWARIGVRHHHGVALTLASLHSNSTAGCGDFACLKEFIPLLASWGFDTLQLLPLNDSGFDASPYMALSGYALHPLYLSFMQLPHFFSSFTRKKLWETLQQETDPSSSRFSFQKIAKQKWELLCHYLNEHQSEIETEPAFKTFCQAHEDWLEPYSAFKALKEFHEGKAWWQWDRAYQLYPTKLPQTLLYQQNRWKVVQYLCFQQLASVKKEADAYSIHLKGDLPILQSKDSSDVWAHRNLFDTSKEVGAPPDAYSKEGQHWGFPLYNWPEHRKQSLSWWKRRLNLAEQFYHIYRLDHIVGFYRLFAISSRKKAKEGIFFPLHSEEWIEQGQALLQELIPSSSMFPIGEDLGSIPDEVRLSLHTLGIPGTKVMRWERLWHEPHQPFIPLAHYSPESVAMVSTHDSSTMKGWSQEQPTEFKEALLAWGIAPATPGGSLFFDILKANHRSSSLFHINLLQEYLSLFPSLSWPSERMNRINIPGTISPWNWTLRLRPSIEQLAASKELLQVMKTYSASE